MPNNLLNVFFFSSGFFSACFSITFSATGNTGIVGRGPVPPLRGPGFEGCECGCVFPVPKKLVKSGFDCGWFGWAGCCAGPEGDFPPPP